MLAKKLEGEMTMAYTFNTTWLDEAIATLDHYLEEPVTNNFLKRFNLYEQNNLNLWGRWFLGCIVIDMYGRFR